MRMALTGGNYCLYLRVLCNLHLIISTVILTFMVTLMLETYLAWPGLKSYNPVLWGVPKGSYASNPSGPCRTFEFRKMVQVALVSSFTLEEQKCQLTYLLWFRQENSRDLITVNFLIFQWDYLFINLFIQALNHIGLRLVLDVVYNHLHASGPFDEDSVLDKVISWSLLLSSDHLEILLF